MNWNAVWNWIQVHVGAIFAVIVAHPAVLSSIGVPASAVGTVTTIAGVLTAAGVVGSNYSTAPAPAVPTNGAPAK